MWALKALDRGSIHMNVQEADGFSISIFLHFVLIFLIHLFTIGG